MTLPADFFPRRAVGSVAGMVGFGGAMGGVIFGLIVGQMLTHGTGYGPVFAIAGSLHVIAFILICLVIPKIQPLNISTTDGHG
jgi:ACS family hexuronate transporter-like MFS transporter